MIDLNEVAKIQEELRAGIPLNLMHVGKVFGHDFWGLLILCMTDAKVLTAQQIIDVMKMTDKEWEGFTKKKQK